MFKILFVCHGNICRSPMAEFVFKDLVKKEGKEKAFEIASAATSTEEIGRDIHRGTRAKLVENHIPFSPRHARQITLKDYAYYDLIVAMDEENLFNMNRKWNGDPENKVHLLMEYCGEQREVRDPWYTGNFDETFEDVLKGCSALLEFLSKAE